MKGKVCLVAGFAFIMLICLMQSALAISTSLKDLYAPGETIIVEVYGNILGPIPAGDVVFKRGHVAIAPEYGVQKLGERYFIWAIAPETANNYTLAINDISTTVSGKVQEIDYEKNFTVAGNLTSYSIKPGFINTQIDFKILVQLNEDLDRTIKVDFPYERNILLKPGANEISFSIADVNQTKLFNISVGKYAVPAYIISDKATPKPKTNATINDSDNGSWIDEEEETPIVVDDEEAAAHYCVEYNGDICAANEVCSGNTKITKDGSCCLNGKCNAEEEGSGGSWIGYVIAALVLIGIVFIWIKYRKVKTASNPLKQVLDKQKKP